MTHSGNRAYSFENNKWSCHNQIKKNHQPANFDEHNKRDGVYYNNQWDNNQLHKQRIYDNNIITYAVRLFHYNNRWSHLIWWVKVHGAN